MENLQKDTIHSLVRDSISVMLLLSVICLSITVGQYNISLFDTIEIDVTFLSNVDGIVSSIIAQALLNFKSVFAPLEIVFWNSDSLIVA